jgi:hypothetical protein
MGRAPLAELAPQADRAARPAAAPAARRNDRRPVASWPPGLIGSPGFDAAAMTCPRFEHRCLEHRRLSSG